MQSKAVVKDHTGWKQTAPTELWLWLYRYDLTWWFLENQIVQSIIMSGVIWTIYVCIASFIDHIVSHCTYCTTYILRITLSYCTTYRIMYIISHRISHSTYHITSHFTYYITFYPVLCPKLTLIQPTCSIYPYHLVFLIWYPYNLVFLIWYPYALISLYGNTAHCSGCGVAMGCYGLSIVPRTAIVTSQWYDRYCFAGYARTWARHPTTPWQRECMAIADF